MCRIGACRRSCHYREHHQAHCLQLIDRAAAELEGRIRVLDLGCGDGSNFRELLRRRRMYVTSGSSPCVDPRKRRAGCCRT